MVKLMQENEKLREVLFNQQGFSEHLDDQEWQSSAAVTGLLENANNIGQDNKEKLKTILESIDASADKILFKWNTLVLQMKRQWGSKHPVLLTLPSKVDHDDIEEGKNLPGQW